VGGEHEPIRHIALSWLRQVLRSEQVCTPPFREASAAARGADAGRGRSIADPFEIGTRFNTGQVERALWYRDWHREWRRLQVPGRLARFGAELLRARRPEEVFRALTEHAVQIVGGYTCILYPPQDATPLRPLANPLLRVDAGRLTLTIPLPEPGAVHRDQVVGSEAGPLAGLAPLFSEDRAVSLAHAPFGEGGLILVVERRAERIFTSDDWEMLTILASLAYAALERVRHMSARVELSAPEIADGVLPDERLQEVLDRAAVLASSGDPLTLAVVRLSGLAGIEALDGREAARRVHRTASEVLRELAGSLGLVVQHGADGFWVVLPRLDRGQSLALLARLRRQLPRGARVEVGAASSATAQTTAELVARATAELEGHTPVPAAALAEVATGGCDGSRDGGGRGGGGSGCVPPRVIARKGDRNR
jgi:GGDEF domain-containing protein